MLYKKNDQSEYEQAQITKQTHHNEITTLELLEQPGIYLVTI